MADAETASVPSALPWALAIFPALELALFCASAFLLASAPLAALLCLLLACLNLSFGIHIFFHECVHLRSDYSNAFKLPASILLGLPFDGYRIHHYNHHIFANGEQDFSTTCRYRDGSVTAYSAAAYAFGWPRQLARSVRCATPFGGSADSADRIKRRIPRKKLALLLTMLFLLWLGWQILLLYLALIYGGWLLTSLHNYGQHPPSPQATGTLNTSTYVGRWYNRLFFNNGLHWEHHHFPGLNWHELTPNDASPRIAQPHILHPVLHSPFWEKQHGR